MAAIVLNGHGVANITGRKASSTLMIATYCITPSSHQTAKKSKSFATMNKAELGQAIATERKAQGITIRKMAEMTDTSTRAVQAVEKGLYNVGIDTYLKLAQTLKLNIQILQL